ncbi:toxin [Chlamydiota bacterium]
MKIFEWDNKKNENLKIDRDLSFEEIIFYIEKGYILDIVPHPNKKKYSGQKMFIIEIDNYAYLVPFVENNEIIFLKTIIPSRKATKKYL